MDLTIQDIDNLEAWWTEKSAKNFFAFRRFMRNDKLLYNWFIEDLCVQLQRFYIKLINGERPILAIQTPPQHGKSWSVVDFITWVLGRHPEFRVIYASFSGRLGTRANLTLQRHMDTDKFKGIFPKCEIPKAGSRSHIRNNEMLEMIGTDGFFRNTTVGGPVTGESCDLGVIDDPIKGREQANSATYREKIWEWLTDDFGTRFSDQAGLLFIMTRWHVDDPVGRLKEKYPQMQVLNYPALAIKDEKHRKDDEPLFPALKSHDFLMGKKTLMSDANFSSLYQGNPVVVGGDMFKDEYWSWGKRRPEMKFKFIVADTAQKVKTKNDWSCFQAWGMGIDNKIHLLDMFRAKVESPELRREAVVFYNKHNTKKIKVTDPLLRAFYIEDKSSGSGLIQELKRKHVKVKAVQRNVDKVFRAEDCIPEIEAGRVVLYEDVPHIGVLTQEAREFPNGAFDDVIDTTMTAIEIAFINKTASNSLAAAMEAEDG